MPPKREVIVKFNKDFLIKKTKNLIATKLPEQNQSRVAQNIIEYQFNLIIEKLEPKPNLRQKFILKRILGRSSNEIMTDEVIKAFGNRSNALNAINNITQKAYNLEKVIDSASGKVYFNYGGEHTGDLIRHLFMGAMNLPFYKLSAVRGKLEETK